MHRRFGVFALGQLTLAGAILFHDGADMHILGRLKAQHTEQLQMDRHRRDPFVPADNMGGAHQMIVHRVGEVIGGDAVGFQQHNVLIVFRHLDGAFDHIIKFDAARFVAGRPQPYNIRLSLVHASHRLVGRQIAADRVGTVIPGALLGGLLPGAHGGQLVRCAEAGIRQPLRHQRFHIRMVDHAALALLIRAVVALDLAGGDKALVDIHTVIGEPFQNVFGAAGDLPLFVGVFQPEVKQSVGGVRGQPVDGGGEQHAQMQVAGGAGGDPGDPCALFQRAGRIQRLVFLRGVLNIRKHPVGQLLPSCHICSSFAW